MLSGMAVANQVLEQALELITSLEDKLDEGPTISSDEEWKAAWKETIERRLRSIDDGTVEMLDGDEVIAEMHALVAAPHP